MISGVLCRTGALAAVTAVLLCGQESAVGKGGASRPSQAREAQPGAQKSAPKPASKLAELRKAKRLTVDEAARRMNKGGILTTASGDIVRETLDDYVENSWETEEQLQARINKLLNPDGSGLEDLSLMVYDYIARAAAEAARQQRRR